MQGYFESFLNGKKGDVDKIIKAINDWAKSGDSMYTVVAGMIGLPDGYDSMNTDADVEVGIGMQVDGYGSRDINFFLNDNYFNDIAKTAPEVSIRGKYYLLDGGPIWNYSSEAGNADVKYSLSYECRNCQKIIEEDELDEAISLSDGDMVCSIECLKEIVGEMLEECEEDEVCPNCEEELDEDCFKDSYGHRFCSKECYDEFKEQFGLEDLNLDEDCEE